MPTETLRYHPTVMVESTLQITGIIAISIVFMGLFDVATVAGTLAAVLVGSILFSYRQWSRTMVIFSESEVVVRRDTLFKLRKNLPYSKIASVNVHRGVVNRVFGTSKLMININSGHNAMAPEATMTFKAEIADRIRAEMSRRLYGSDTTTEETDEAVQPLVKFTKWDVVIHGLFSVPTSQTILGAVLLAYSVIEMYLSTVEEIRAGGTVVVSLFMFFLVQVMPSVSQVVHYYDFKVYRKGDTIHLEHGLIRKYQTSFSVHKINAVRVKSTLPARLMHRSCIEAEVVGIGSGDRGNSPRPSICLLKDDATTQRLLRELLPEFVYEHNASKQPLEARSAMRTRAAIISVILVLGMAYPSMLVLDKLAVNPVEGIPGAVLPYVLPLITALAILALFYAANASYRIRGLGTGEDLFTFVNGVLDREVVTMSYDKVQMVRITRGPITGLFGVSSGVVFLLSSTGTKGVRSGLFSEDRLEEINTIIIDRISTGKYDPSKNGV